VKPGRELDALVAEKVMGFDLGHDALWQDVYSTPDALVETSQDRKHRRTLPNYSTDIAAAWEVVENVTSGDNEGFALTKQPGTIGASFSNLSGKAPYQSNGDTAPHAICLAALKALGEE
jgi:hypothetical protein